MYDILTHSSAVLRCQWQSQLKRIVCTFYSDSEKLNSTVTWTLPILGVHVANDLKWTCHVDAITSIISSLLYFLKQLKRSGAEPDNLLCFYTTTIRPVAEYACPVWYSSLTAAQTKALESLYSGGRWELNENWTFLTTTTHRHCHCRGVETLASRREQLTERLYMRSVLRISSCLHYLRPDKRNPAVTERLRHPQNI